MTIEISIAHPHLSSNFHIKCLQLLWVDEIDRTKLSMYSPASLNDEERHTLWPGFDLHTTCLLKFVDTMHSHGLMIHHLFNGQPYPSSRTVMLTFRCSGKALSYKPFPASMEDVIFRHLQQQEQRYGKITVNGAEVYGFKVRRNVADSCERILTRGTSALCWPGIFY